MPSSLSILDHSSALEDPRQHWRVIFPLPEILLLVLCATLCGMDDFVEFRLWGDQRLSFLRRLLPYARGLPAHDTLTTSSTRSTPTSSRPRHRSAPTASGLPSGSTGRSRTDCTGSSTSPSTTINRASAPLMLRRT